MPRFRAFILREVRALHDNGLIISIGKNHLTIKKVDPWIIKEELKSWPKQYEITEEKFNSEFKELLAQFPEVKEVVNA